MSPDASRPPARVSVVVPVKDDAERLAACLGALARQQDVTGPIEVVVADNGSLLPVRDLVAAFGARLVEHRAGGSYAARHAAVAVTTGEVVAFTDSDCLPEPGWLAEHLRVLDADTSLAATGGRVVVFPRLRNRPGLWERHDALTAFPQERYAAWGFSVTANLAVRRAAYDAVGGFDRGAVSGGDADFGRRLMRAGLTMAHVPTAVVRHPARHTARQVLGKTVRTTRGARRAAAADGWAGVRADLAFATRRTRRWLSTLMHARTSPALSGPWQRLGFVATATADHAVALAVTAAVATGRAWRVAAGRVRGTAPGSPTTP